MKKVILALALAAACNAHAALIVGANYVDSNAVVWTYIGDYNVGAGPVWSSGTATNYTALQAAALVFGNLVNGQQYAISTSTTTVNHQAWYDGYGDGTYLPTTNVYGGGRTLAENFFADVGRAGYTQYGDYSAYVGGDRAAIGGGAFNHVFVSAQQAVPEPGSVALFGLGLAAFGLGRRKGKTTPKA